MSKTIKISSVPIPNGKSIFIIRDDYVPGGTKSRGINPLVKLHSTIEKFIYAGPSNGFAQLALALACKKYERKAVLFTSGSPSRITEYLKLLPNVKIIMTKANLWRTQSMAKKYHQNQKKKTMLLPFGFSSVEFKIFLKNDIVVNLPDILRDLHPRRIWLAAGSGTLLQCLSEIFPNTKFMVVRVGKYIPDECVDSSRMRIFTSNEYFSHPAKYLPPYPSVATYDAKVWQYVLKYGKSGDFIWNVARDI